MENIPEDIYSKYPLLGIPLSGVSKRLTELTYNALCDQNPTKKEILNYFENNNNNRIGIFKYKENQLEAYVHVNDPILLWQYSPDELMVGLSKIEERFENGIYINFPKFIGLSTLKNDVARDLLFEDDILFIDVKNAYKIFSNRKQCKNAKIKTKEYFNYVINLLTGLNKINLMHFYLLVNATILKLLIDFDTMRLFEIDDGEDVTYNEYYERTYEEANKIIKLTLIKIDTFKK